MTKKTGSITAPIRVCLYADKTLVATSSDPTLWARIFDELAIDRARPYTLADIDDMPRAILGYTDIEEAGGQQAASLLAAVRAANRRGCLGLRYWPPDLADSFACSEPEIVDALEKLQARGLVCVCRRNDELSIEPSELGTIAERAQAFAAKLGKTEAPPSSSSTTEASPSSSSTTEASPSSSSTTEASPSSSLVAPRLYRPSPSLHKAEIIGLWRIFRARVAEAFAGSPMGQSLADSIGAIAAIVPALKDDDDEYAANRATHLLPMIADTRRKLEARAEPQAVDAAVWDTLGDFNEAVDAFVNGGGYTPPDLVVLGAIELAHKVPLPPHRARLHPKGRKP